MVSTRSASRRFRRSGKEFDYFHLYREYCGFYCGPKHRFFGRSDLKVSDLAGENAVTYPSAVFSDELQSIADFRRRIDFADPYVGVSNNTEELKRMIIAGFGIGPIPVHVAERDVAEGLLWRLPPYENVMEIDVYLITNPATNLSRSERGLRRHAAGHRRRDTAERANLPHRVKPR